MNNEREMKMEQTKNTALGAAALAVALTMAAAGCQQGSDADPTAAETAVPATVVTVALTDTELSEVAVATAASGSVEAWRRVSLATKLMGRVAELTVRAGDRVRQGDVIARIESADLEAAVAQARAALVMAEATLTNAAAHRARMEQLHEQRSVTDKNLEDTIAAARVAVARVDVAGADLEAAEVMLSYAVVRTPIAGWVTQQLIEAGDMATPGRPMVVVEDLSRVKVLVDVPEGVVARLAPGQPAEVTILGRARSATIDRIVPSGDPATRTFAVEMVLDNHDGGIKVGMFARATFATGTRSALLIPRSAVINRGQLTGVFVVGGDNRATLRWIKLGAPIGEHVEVLSGLQVEEQYVSQPTPEVHDGVHVAVRQ